MSSPMSVLKPHKKYLNTPRKSAEDHLKLPQLMERSRNLYGRNYHTAVEAYNFTAQDVSSEVEMPNLLCDYTSVDLTNRESTPDNIDRFVAHFGSPENNTTSRKGQSKASPRNKQGYNPKPPDIALMTSMAQRLRIVETQLKDYSKEIIEKDVKIKQLEERLRNSEMELRKHQQSQNGYSLFRLERQCAKLQKQVDDMENFLEDYGMLWVGEPENSEEEDVDESLDSRVEGLNDLNQWTPNDSVYKPTEVPFDALIKAVRDLNVLVGEGVARVSQTKTGATFKVPEPVNLEFYADGFILFEGPFRLFSDPFSQEFVRDLLDGYFPSELREKFPDGIPFAVKDRRDTYYIDPSCEKERPLFPGSGHKLLNELDARIGHPKSGVAHRRGQSSKEFARKLPLSVVKNGKVIDIRNDIESQLNPDRKPEKSQDKDSGVAVLATKFMKEVYELDPTGKDMSHFDQKVVDSISTLRIRSENGQNFFIAKMYKSETIGDIRRYLATVMADSDVTKLQIMTTYPKKVIHADDSKSLEDLGLVPSAVLALKGPKP